MKWTRAGAGSLVAAAIAAFVYALTLAPSVGSGDSGELILAAHVMGIPHPPGYPLWVLFARCMDLLPWGATAFRVNALSALLSACAAGLCYALAGRCGLDRLGRIAATAMFAGSTLVWDAAVETEVYALTSVVLLLLALTAFRARSKHTGGARADAVFFFTAGLSLLTHQTLFFPAVVLGAWVLSRGFSIARLITAVTWSLAGFSVVFLLPLRSGANPILDWGHDRSLLALWDNLLRRNYGGLRQNGYSLNLSIDEVVAMAGVAATSLGGIATGLAGVGVFAAGRARATLLPLTLAAFTIPAALMGLVVFTPDAEHLAQVGPFLIPVTLVVALWAGAAARGLWLIPRLARAPLAAVLCAGILATCFLHYGLCDRSGFRLPERYGRDLLSDLPYRATLVVDGDNETFLTAYLTRVEGYRKDVNLINRRGYVFGDPYGLRGVPRSRWGEIQHRVDLERLRTSSTPVYYASPPGDLLKAGVTFRNQGLVYRATLPDSSRGKRERWPSPLLSYGPWPRSTELLPGGPERYDYVTRKLAITYSATRAQLLWDLNRYQAAYSWFEDAARVGFDFPAAHMNLAVAAAALGKQDVTLAELLTALRLAPYDPEPSARLAMLFAVAGRYRDAAFYFERAYRIQPSVELAMNAARAWSLAGERVRAQAWEARR